jgi:serine protease
MQRMIALTSALTMAAALPVMAQDLAEIGFEESGWQRTFGDAPAPDGLLVDLKDDLDEDEIDALERELGVTFTETADVFAGNRYEIHGMDLEQAKRILDGRDEIESVEWNVQYSLFRVDAADDDEDDEGEATSTKPNDPMYKSQWHFDMVNAEEAWKTSQGDGVIVAVIDTGVSPGKLPDGKKSRYKRVPDLGKTPFANGYNFVNNNKDPSDGNGHGTHVAGTISQSTNNNMGVAGLAYKSTIMPIKVLSDRGFGSVGDIANGIRFAADNGAKVINMSLGGGMYSSTLARAVKYAHSKGVFLACAAGNGAREKVEYPAKYPGCTAVSALGPDGKLAFYSSYGKELAIAAPGGDTRVDLNKDGIPDGVLQDTIARGDPSRHGYFPFQGTSMATPHVAAGAALVMATGVTDPDKVEKILRGSAKKLNDATRYGSGGLDAAAAVKKASHDKSFFALGITALLGFALLRTRRKNGVTSKLMVKPGLGMGLGALFGASGLFFLRDLGAADIPVLGTLAHPVIEWPSAVLGISSINPILASVLLVAAVVALFWGFKMLRPVIAGFIVGVAGFLISTGLLGFHDISWIPGHGFFDAAWLVVNGVLAAGLAKMVIRR